MNDLFINLLSTVEHTINQYHMFTNNSVYVALSGGKDSLFLCLALKELGYKVTGVTVDIGYNVSWSILKQNAENLGINLLILTADTISGCSSKYVTQSVLSCFEHVKSLVEHPVGVETICTPCYNAKIIILKQWAESNHINEIAFGHHATDSIASLLKSYFYYYDHICCGSLNFEYKRFEKLVQSKSTLLIDESNSLEWKKFIEHLNELSQKRIIGTDEPLKKYMEDSFVQIVRPLFYIFENEIKKFFLSQKIEFEKSECVVSNYFDPNTYSPRQMIYHYITNQMNLIRQKELLNIVKLELDTNGFLKYNVRNNRDKILGEYKTSDKTKIKL